VGFLLVLCIVLTVLQYRWTGDVSRAEAARLRAGLAEQVNSLANAFDVELARSCAALIPSRTELRETNCADAFAMRYREWRASNPRPIFRRVAVAVPTRNAVDLFAPDETTGKAALINWPVEWTPLREFVTRLVNGGRPGLDDRSGEFLEFPIFGGRLGGGPGGSEYGWLLVQLDLAYLRTTWLPELVRFHLSLGEAAPYEVTVTDASAKRVLFATAADQPPGGDVLFTARFHRDGLPVSGNDSGRRNGPGGDLPGRRVSRDGGLWTLQIHQRPGALESLVATSRWRNLGVAVLVNGLILAAGVALVVHTQRSRALAEAQMNFVATVSHELRTPLTVIRGAGHNLLRGVVKERAQIEQYAKLIIDHAEQLKELVEQTLALAGSDSGRAAQVRERVEIPRLLQDAIAAVAEDTQAARCEVHLESPPSLPPLSGDAAALRRVFQNLITNAAKHGGDGRWIGITLVPVPGSRPPMVDVRVTDRGAGIPASEQSEVFKPFFRGAAAQAKQIRGSGLGLSVVRQIVEAHGGNVSVESGAGRGTTFTVRLPTES
jgi:signal transduction histidine kinase